MLEKKIRGKIKGTDLIKSEPKDSDQKKISFKMVGEVVEALVDYIYNHKFTQLPLSAIDNEKVVKILNDSVRIYFLKIKLFIFLIITTVLGNKRSMLKLIF